MPTKNVAQNRPYLGELVVIFKEDAQVTTSRNAFRTSKGTSIRTLNSSIKNIKSKVQPIFNPKISLDSMPDEFRKFAKASHLKQASFFKFKGET